MSNNDKTDLLLPMIYGGVLHGLLYYGIRVYSHVAAIHAALGSLPAWYLLSYPLLWALASTVPGFVAGWMARQSAFALGASIGAVASLIEQPVFDIHWRGGPLPWHLVAQIVTYALGPALVSAVACAAGQLARNGAGCLPQPAVAPEKTIARPKSGERGKTDKRG